MSYRTRIRLCTILIVFAISFAHAAELRAKPSNHIIEFRIVATEDAVHVTTFGASSRSYLVELRSGVKGPQLVKLMYRDLFGQPSLPSRLLDYTLVHRFRATRDESCDSSIGDLSYAYQFDAANHFTGRQSGLQYATFAPVVAMPESQVVPCYVIGAGGYKGSRSISP